MKFKTTWILFIILVVVAGYFYLVDERSKKAKEKEKKESRKIFRYSSSDVEKMIFTNPDGLRITMEKVGDKWKITSPVVTKGDDSMINTVIRQVVPGHKLEEMKNVPNLADYGLEKPFASIVLYSKTKTKPDTVFVGDKTPTSSSCYVRVGSTKDVLICREMTHNVMNKNLYHLRDKNFLDFKSINSSSIDKFTIKNGRRKIELVKKGNFWWLADRGVRADKTKIAPYLNKLTRAIIKKFVREDTKVLKPYGLEHPLQTITLQRGSEVTEISFGKTEDDEIYVVRTGLDKVIRLDKNLLKAFDWTEKDLRAMNIAFYDTDVIKSVMYEGPDTTCTFIKGQDKKWKVANNDSLIIKSYLVNSLLRKISSIEFERITREPLPEFDERLEHFAERIILSDADGKIVDKITIVKGNRNDIAASISANAIGEVKNTTHLEIEKAFDGIGKP